MMLADSLNATPKSFERLGLVGDIQLCWWIKESYPVGLLHSLAAGFTEPELMSLRPFEPRIIY